MFKLLHLWTQDNLRFILGWCTKSVSGLTLGLVWTGISSCIRMYKITSSSFKGIQFNSKMWLKLWRGVSGSRMTRLQNTAGNMSGRVCRRRVSQGGVTSRTPWPRLLLLIYTKILLSCGGLLMVGASWNVTAHAQKPHFVFRAKRTSPFKSARWGASVQSTAGSPRCAYQR